MSDLIVLDGRKGQLKATKNINFPSIAFFLRDEARRFAIFYHRLKRKKEIK